jgi:hypothetical protein
MASMVLKITFNNYNILGSGELSIVTCYRLNGLGFKFQWGQRDFLVSTAIQTGLGVYPAFCAVDIGLLPRGKMTREWL